MSLPGLGMGSMGVAASAVALSPMDSMLHLFNTNPYFIGLMMFLLNVGGRFIGLEVTKQQELFFQHPWVRRALIFAVLFVATRSIWVAFWCTVAIILLFGYLFNENSAMCLFGQGGVAGATCMAPRTQAMATGAGAAAGGLTPEEREILQRLSSKAQRFLTPTETEEEDVPIMDVYSANLALLQRT